MNLLNIAIKVSGNQQITDGLKFSTEHLPVAISYMLRGMGGIFVGLFVIYLASIGLQKLFPEKAE